MKHFEALNQTIDRLKQGLLIKLALDDIGISASGRYRARDLRLCQAT